jgi:hypothetical protein
MLLLVIYTGFCTKAFKFLFMPCHPFSQLHVISKIHLPYFELLFLELLSPGNAACKITSEPAVLPDKCSCIAIPNKEYVIAEKKTAL